MRRWRRTCAFWFAYSSKYGSTREIAEAIAGEIRHAGIDTDIKTCADVSDLSGYDGVVVGSPLYVGKILKDTRRFLSRLRSEITSRPSALFLVGPVRQTDDMGEARGQIARVLERAPWFTPEDTGMFVGAYDPGKLRFPDSLAATLPASPLHDVEASDDRDWLAIREWTVSTIEKFRS